MPDDLAPPPLSAADREEFHAAILSGYGQSADLARVFDHKLGLRLADFVYLHQANRKIADEVMAWADAEGRLLELLGVLWSGRPGNPKLKALAERLLPDLEAVAAQYGARPPTPTAPLTVNRRALEKVVTERSRLIDYGAFVERLEHIGAAVCRVEAGPAMGTGFLIGRQSVLTNHHVIDAARSLPGDAIRCVFQAAGPTLPEETALGAPGAAWLGPNAPYSQSDLTGTGEPLPGQLDFAVIRLAAPVSAARAPLALSPTPGLVAPLDVALIAQHPGGDPLQIALGTVLEFPASGLRYRYSVTTLPGTSGAPVFSASLDLIGLHHAADPATAPLYNQAVPIWRIARAIADAGLALDSL